MQEIIFIAEAVWVGFEIWNKRFLRKPKMAMISARRRLLSVFMEKFMLGGVLLSAADAIHQLFGIFVSEKAGICFSALKALQSPN